LKVGEVWYPTVGGLGGFGAPGEAGQAAVVTPASRKACTLPFGEFAAAYPGGMQMGFVEVEQPARNRSLYLGAHDEPARYKQWRFAEAGRDGDRDIVARLVHFPYLAPGGHFEGAPWVLRFHDGDWRAGGRIYREWFVKAFGIRDPHGDWVRNQGFFQMTMFMLPEGNINFTFKDIPRWAHDARKYGVKAVQVSGWQRGGHDNGYPYYEPDPRLGTWEDLERGIAACHRMGMKVNFFANLQPVMLDLDWYKEELKDYQSESRSGDPYWIAGWGMGTLASRMGLTTPLMAFDNPAFGPFADALVGYFTKLASIGADGVHLDKMFPAGLDFNPRLPLSPDCAAWQGALDVIARVDRECRGLNPDFTLSFECNWDRVLQYGTTTWWAGNMSAAKQVFPEVVETVGHYQPFDYAGVNNAVRLGYAVMVAPMQFTRSMDFPVWRDLSRYIGEVKAIRDDLAGAVFVGEPMDKGQVMLGGGKASAGLDYAVYRDPSTGKRVCIFMNSGASDRVQRFDGFTGGTGVAVQVRRPFARGVELGLPADVPVGGERVTFVVER